jgi:O-antigen/teichoic acid export membrane protein
MARLGLKYVGESLAAWFFSWGDGLLVVKFLGVADLGLYRVGRSIVDLVFYTLLNPFLPIIFPAFSRLQKDPDTVNKTFKKATSLCIALCCPIGMGLLLLGPSLATLVYGQKWEGLGFVISICGLASGVSWMVGINAEVYRAMGRPEINVKIMVASILLYLAAYSLSLGGGLRWFVVARLVAAVLVIPMHVFVCSKVMKINVSYIWQHGKEAYLSTSIMAVCVLGELWLFANIGTHKISWWNAIALALSGVCVYVGCLYLTNKQFAVESLRLGRKMAS